jgi:phosphoribosylformylglycinamidine cyclo-ligase
MNSGPIHYKDHVDYDALDPFTRLALTRFEDSYNNPEKHGIRLLPESLGETASVFEFAGFDSIPFYIAQNAEILGTKVKVAEEMAQRDPGNKKRYFSNVNQDTANMSFNDLTCVGAQPFGYNSIIVIGANEYLGDDEKNDAFLDGFVYAANQADSVIPGGETGTCKGIVEPDTADLAGASIGIISPKERFLHGGRVKPGLELYAAKTISPHANGLTTIRLIADRMPYGYFTELPSGRTFGEAVLEPTPGYSRLVSSLFEEGVPLEYVQPITGHGFKKIARARKDLRYVIQDLPKFPEVFSFIQEKQGIDVKEMLETYNCGVGWVLYALPGHDNEISDIGRKSGYDIFRMGQVEEGERSVVVKPLNVTFSKKDIQGK